MTFETNDFLDITRPMVGYLVANLPKSEQTAAILRLSQTSLKFCWYLSRKQCQLSCDETYSPFWDHEDFPSRFRSPGCLCWHPDFRNHLLTWQLYSHVLLSRTLLIKKVSCRTGCCLKNWGALFEHPNTRGPQKKWDRFSFDSTHFDIKISTTYYSNISSRFFEIEIQYIYLYIFKKYICIDIPTLFYILQDTHLFFITSSQLSACSFPPHYQGD